MKYISSVLAFILTVLAFFSPILATLVVIEIISYFPLSFGNWRAYTDMIRIPSTHYEPLSFAPAQYIMSLSWVKSLILLSGYPTIMEFLIPILVYLLILLISVFLLYILFLIVFGSIEVFLIFLRSLPFLLFHLCIKILRSLWSMVFGNNPFRAFWIWINTYLAFLLYYITRIDPVRIMKTHNEFLSYLLPFRKIPIQGESYHVLKTKYENRKLVLSFNIVLKRIFSNQEKQYPYIAYFSRNKGELGFSIMRGDSGTTLSEMRKISEHEKDFTVEMRNGLFKMMTPQETPDGLEVKIVTRYDWKIQTISPIEFENLLSDKKHGDIPMGFFPRVSQGVADYATYFVSLKDFGHRYIGAKSTAGKDSLVRACIMATLIKSPYRKGYVVDSKDDKFEIVFIDTKSSDASYLSGVPGCRRVLNEGDTVARTLEECVTELESRLKSFGLLGNISQWNKKHTYEEKYSYQYIFINEINDLLSATPKGKTEGDLHGRIVRATRSLLNRGLAGGFHVILLGQSLRKEGSELGSLLTNTGRIIGAMGNDDEARVALKSYYKDFGNLEKYNFVYIQDSGEAKQVFRPYLTSQEEISEWIDKNFDRIVEDEEITNDQASTLDPKDINNIENQFRKDKTKDFSYLQSVDIQALFNEAFKTRRLSRKLAIDFGVREKVFPFLTTKLSELGILKVREGMTAEIPDHVTIEDTILQVQALLKNNQD